MRIRTALILACTGLGFAWAMTGALEDPQRLTEEASEAPGFTVEAPEAPTPAEVVLASHERPVELDSQVVPTERTPVAVTQPLSTSPLALPAPPPAYTGPALVVPTGLLLDAEATDEDFADWYADRSSDTLIRLTVRVRKYDELAQELIAQLGAAHPELESYHENLGAMVREQDRLGMELQLRKKDSFSGPLPARLNEVEADFVKQYGFLSEEDFAVARWQVDHAFHYERGRIAEKRFENGDYDERVPKPLM